MTGATSPCSRIATVATLGVLLVCARPRPATAQRDDAGGAVPTSSRTGYVSEDGPTILPHDEVNVGIAFAYDHARPIDVRLPAKVDRFAFHVLGAFGLFGRLELGVHLRAVLRQVADPMPAEDFRREVIADSRVAAKVRLWTSGNFSLLGATDLWLPTGKPSSFSGDGSPGVHPRVIAGHAAGPLSGALSLGYWLHSGAGDAAMDSLTAGMGLSAAASKRVQLVTDARIDHAIGGHTDLRAHLGARFTPLRWAALMLIVGAERASPDAETSLSLLVSLLHIDRCVLCEQPAKGAEPACAHGPEDVDGFEDGDRCRDPDNDGDGILDRPDRCPNDAEDKDAFQDQDGCPDPDNDTDGLLDGDDACPLEAEDKDGFEDADGCPDLDNDGDAIVDLEDQCPLVAEDKDGFEDADGCPDLDNDADAILDAVDKCPDKPETFNAIEDGDGCPEEQPTLAVLTPEFIEIKRTIHFKTGKAAVHPRSFPVLEAVANIMRLHPELTKIGVEGHTDSKGSNRSNLKLSNERAAAVRKHLVEVLGIAADRLVSEGFGEEKPKSPGSSWIAMAINRRVEFRIRERSLTLGAPGTTAPATAPATTPGPAAPAPAP
jgi:outer membrane protein OmpA-like peptidoglycan-associated protein